METGRLNPQTRCDFFFDDLNHPRPRTEPKRCADLLQVLPIARREPFWTEIWDPVNDPEKLSQYRVIPFCRFALSSMAAV